MTARILVLVPTETERSDLNGRLRPRLKDECRVELCGFGLAAAGVRSSQLLASYEPDMVLLLGIAGSLDSTLELGCAYEFSSVGCYGIGAGEAEAFLTSDQMGWPQWVDRASNQVSRIGCFLDLESQTERMLLSVASASGSTAEVARKRERFPQALAEDMEGFAVALACQLARRPLRILRGISNRAGDRDAANWQITKALQAVSELANEVLQG